MAFLENSHLFFDTIHGFAVTAAFKGADISVIFDNGYFAVPGEEVDVSSSQPAVFCRTEDVSTVVQGDTLSIYDGGTARDYTVTEVRPDGTGMTVLALEKLPKVWT